MDRGTRGRLKNQAGLQVYSDLESLGEKQNKNNKKKKETQVTHYDRVEGRGPEDSNFFLGGWNPQSYAHSILVTACS